MNREPATERGRVIGVGGVFFKSADRDRLHSWYEDNLGLVRGVEGFEFKWRSHDQPEIEQRTAWSVFPADSDYFDPSRAPFMINYIVDDLDAILANSEKRRPGRSQARGLGLRPLGVDLRPGREQNRALGAARRVSAWFVTDGPRGPEGTPTTSPPRW